MNKRYLYDLEQSMKRLFLSLYFFTFCAWTATAQTNPPLSLNKAIEMTLSQNPNIKSAHYNEQAAVANRKATKGLYMPQINLIGNYSHLGKNIAINTNHLKQNITTAAGDIISSAIQTEIISQNTAAMLSNLLGEVTNLDWNYTLQNRSFGFIGAEVSVPIFLGGKINAAYHASQIEESIAKQHSQQVENSLISELIERYYALSLITRVVQVKEQVVAGINKHLQDAIALERQGMIARSELLYVEYKMAEAERELYDAQGELSTTKEALKAILSTDEDFTATTPMFVLKAIDDITHYKLLADNNSIISQVELKKDLSEQAVRINRAEFFPQITAMGVANIYNHQVSGLLPRWAVGIGVNFKIFDGLNRENKYKAAKATANEVEQIAAGVHKDINLLVDKLYNQLQNYHNRLNSIASSIRFAEEYRQAKERAFQEGLATASELVDAELNLAKARTERLEAAFEYDITLARLLEAAGISINFMDYIHSSEVQIIE